MICRVDEQMDRRCDSVGDRGFRTIYTTTPFTTSKGGAGKPMLLGKPPKPDDIIEINIDLERILPPVEDAVVMPAMV